MKYKSRDLRCYQYSLELVWRTRSVTGKFASKFANAMPDMPSPPVWAVRYTYWMEIMSSWELSALFIDRAEL